MGLFVIFSSFLLFLKRLLNYYKGLRKVQRICLKLVGELFRRMYDVGPTFFPALH